MRGRAFVVRGLVGIGLGLTVGCGTDTAEPATDRCSKQAGVVCEVAGSGELAFTGDGKPALSTAFYHPTEVRRGPDGLVYIMDFNNMRLRRIEANGTISTIAGDGFHAGANAGAIATDSSLENPIDFDFLPDGRVAFVSQHDPRVLAIASDRTLQVIAGDVFVGQRGNEGDGGPAAQALFIQTTGVVVAPDGAIYVADDDAHRIRVIKDGAIDTYAGTGNAGYQGDGGPAVLATINGPTALALDAAGNLYFADDLSHVVRKVATDGTITTVAGTGTRGFAGDGGAATAAQLNAPRGIAIADDGTLFIGDSFNGRVRKVAPDGTISTIAGFGIASGSEVQISGDNGPATEARFGYVARIQLDTDGGLFVADQTNGCVRKIYGPL